MLKLAGFVFLTALSVYADDVRPIAPMSSQAPIGARFEVIADTPVGYLRLDRFAGKTWRMVQEQGRASRWVDLDDIGQGLPADSIPRYQNTYLNNRMDTYLLVDTTSGSTWRLNYDQVNRRWTWRPVEEPGR